MFGGNKPFGTATSFTGSSFTTPGTGFGQNTTAFGTRPATGMFGGSFGTTAPAAGSSIFTTNTNPAGTGLFGQPTGFGTPVSTGSSSFGFGATTTSSSLFGASSQPNTSTSLFGANTTSAFGTPRPAFGGFTTTSTPSLFGQPQQPAGSLFTQTPGVANTGGLFSASGFSAAPTGTTIKFAPPTGTDTMMKNGASTNISTRHQCITCMKEYENKSLEELRMEDYSANRKGPQQQQAGTGLFGTPASTSFSFGNTQNKPLFGTTPTTAPGFGATTGTSLFGQTSQPQQQQQATGLFSKPNLTFGAPTTTTAGNSFSFGTSIFGNNTQQKPLFGQMAGGNLFGGAAATQAQPTSVFGSTPVFGSSFGATTQNTGGLLGNKPVFGATATPGTTSAFNFNPATSTGATSSFFGAKATGTATTFPATTPFSSFTATTNTGTGLFGQTKPVTAFGTPAFGTGLNTGFSLGGFGSQLTTNTGTSLFNTASTANKPNPFGGFGTGFGNSLFSNPTNPTGTVSAFGSTVAPNLVGGDPSAVNLANQLQAQQQILALTSNPFGYSSLFTNPIKNSNRREEVLKPTNPSAQKSLLNSFKVPSQPTGKIKPVPLQTASNGKISLFNGLEEEAETLANETFIPRKSVKKLTVKPKLSPEKPVDADSSRLLSPRSEAFPGADQRNGDILPSEQISKISPVQNKRSDAMLSPSDDFHFNKPLPNLNSTDGITALENTISELQPRRTELFRAIHSPKGVEDELDEDDLGPGAEESQPDSSSGPESNGEANEDVPPSKCGVVLKRAGYYTLPPLDKLDALVDEDGNCFVDNFTVGRENYGNVFFPGVTNVSDLNLDEIVHFRRKEVTVYVDDDKKPPMGDGLNKKAQVTLDCVWPNDRTTLSPIQGPERLKTMGYEATLEKATSRMGAKFIEYRPETGSWVFQVQHF